MKGRGLRRLAAVCAGVMIAGLGVATIASASTGYTQTAEVSASNGTTTDSFGYASAISGDGHTALVGAPFISALAGQVNVFTPAGTGWAQQTTIVGTDTVATDTFGTAVAITNDGTVALIGAPGKAGSTGAAYFFTRSGSAWTQVKELTGPAAASGFGVSVALSSDGATALVGANLAGSTAGAAYVYTRSGSNWILQQQLSPTVAPAAGDEFGWSVSLASDGNTALVGAPATANTSGGSAYAFTRSGTTWTQHQHLAEATPGSGDAYGYSVALSADATTAIVGADGVSTSAGTAFVYTTGSTWTQQAQVTPADPASGDTFGQSVALDANGGTAVVGAPQQSTFTGAAYVFTRTGSSWAQAQKLTAGDASVDHEFGKSVSTNADGTTVLIGDDSKGSSGAAYFFAAPTPSPSPTPAAGVQPAVPAAGAVSATTLPGTGILVAGLGALLFGAVARRRRSTLP